jgi:hypothetical protein
MVAMMDLFKSGLTIHNEAHKDGAECATKNSSSGQLQKNCIKRPVH